ncbi:uncharacterized protein LOC130049787 [Ostrea edulis]|uniref:uncharacterized protein LOC130049787 n=1 Tax=Ostrea edulis TaxID=37623 RepID=UPI0024AEF217|nr:uncharacterized protein LOC130049787 [Ostrea edulis]
MGGLEADKEDKVFRKWFRLVGEIRSYFPEASLFGLNMTCTKTIKKRVIEVLGLKDYTNITVSRNKENIKYIVKKVDPNIERSLLWILDSIRDLKKEFPRTLFYCISIRDVGCVYNFIVSELSDVTNIENMVEMFHSETTLRNVDQDVKDFLTSTDCRILQLLKPFLSESELKLKKYMTNLSLDDVHVMETSSSDSDTVSYESESDEDLDEIKST